MLAHYCRVDPPVRGQHLEAVVGELLLQVGPHRTLVLHKEDRPSDHVADASKGWSARLDVLSRKSATTGLQRCAQPSRAVL